MVVGDDVAGLDEEIFEVFDISHCVDLLDELREVCAVDGHEVENV